MFNKVIVPLDGSSHAEAALQLAMQVTVAGGELILLQAVPTPPSVRLFMNEGEVAPEDAYRLSAQAHLLGERYLLQLQLDLPRKDVTLRSIVLSGDEASVIVDSAEAEDVDLIVMGAVGRSRLTEFILGSVADKVMQEANCPVLIARSGMKPEKIMMTTDGSSLAEYALASAIEMAKQTGAALTFFRAEPPIGMAPLEMKSLKIRRYLQQLADSVDFFVGDIAVEMAVGQVVPTILNALDEDQIDLVVLATHGRTGLRRWAMGSVTQKIVRLAKCSVLVVRPPKNEMY